MRFYEQSITAKKQFIMVPSDLFNNEQYMGISMTACVVYGKLYGLTKLSNKNDWKDEDGAIFCCCTLSNMASFFGFSESTASRALNELVKYGLLERIKNGRGRSDLLYLHTTSDSGYEPREIFASELEDVPDEVINFNFALACMDESQDISVADVQTEKIPASITESREVSTCASETNHHHHCHTCKSSPADLQAKYKTLKDINNISSNKHDIYLYNKNTIDSSKCQEPEKNIFAEDSDLICNEDFVAELNAIGLSQTAIDKLLHSYPVQELRTCMGSLYTKLADGIQIRNPAGLFIYMMKNSTQTSCILTARQVKEKIQQSLVKQVQQLGFSELISNLLISIVQRGERFSITERSLCEEIGFQPEIIYHAIQANDFSACCTCRC